MTFSPLVVSAPSKLILFGEHSVVYGHRALAASLNLRTRMKISPISHPLILIHFPDVDVQESWPLSLLSNLSLPNLPLSLSEIHEDVLLKLTKLLEIREKTPFRHDSLLCFFYLYLTIVSKDNLIPMKIEVESEIPIGAGLGSSAALSVCLAAGLLSVSSSKDSIDLASINQLALLSEKIIHGTPSGIDNSISTYGGSLSFQGGQLKNARIPQLRILLVNSHQERSTKALLTSVQSRYSAHPNIVQPILEAMNSISETAIALLEQMTVSGSSSYEELEVLLNYNQKLLEALHVSHDRCEKILRICKTHHLHGKLTGAGGGGFVYVLLPPSLSETQIFTVIESLSKEGFEARETVLGVTGVVIKKL